MMKAALSTSAPASMSPAKPSRKAQLAEATKTLRNISTRLGVNSRLANVAAFSRETRAHSLSI